jgi:hypothetical protein
LLCRFRGTATRRVGLEAAEHDGTLVIPSAHSFQEVRTCGHRGHGVLDLGYGSGDLGRYGSGYGSGDGNGIGSSEGGGDGSDPQRHC